MNYIADLHIHSRYSRATSKEGTPEHLDLWARKKGISIVGTGDFTHPAWREEMEEKLTPAEDGLYKLKEEYILKETGHLDMEAPRFVISGEISSIYKKNGKTRKVHNVILLPSLEDAERLSKKLETIGNIHSDGRPILGLDCRELLEIMLDICPEGIFIPAHIWTPHFSLFGAFSGFDTIEECFEDLTPQIRALETGLSSDPPMNWRWSALDRFNLVSNSDAHSPGKLGREANLLDIEMSYQGLYRAIQEGEGLSGTIEFFPEEGKYHFDGHRKCHLCLSPKEAEKYEGKCPVCGKKLTIGVDHRIVQLSDREDGFVKENGRPFESLVPLPEVIGASTGRSASSKKVMEQYENMIANLGTEFSILREVPTEDIQALCGGHIAEGIKRLRAGQVKRNPGFDGEYGTIQLFDPDEIQNLEGQMSFFAEFPMQTSSQEDAPVPGREKEDAPVWKNEEQTQEKETGERTGTEALAPAEEPNSRQKEAVESFGRTVAVIAGPGTGKTKTLVAKILYLLENRRVMPSEITAVTFTNQAAREMKERILKKTGAGRNFSRLTIGTFHSICLDFLKKQGKEVILAQESDKEEWADTICREYGLDISAGKFLSAVSVWKTKDGEVPGREETVPEAAMEAYQKRLKENARYDFDDLLLETLCIFEEKKKEEQEIFKEFSYLLVDEFQDISPLQYRLVKAWNRYGRELFVIGDPDQSIYGFRGSDGACFEHIKEDFPEAQVVALTENYRSTGNILKGAVNAVSFNGGEERYLHPVKEEGLPIRVVETGSKMAEAIFAAKEITRIIGGIDMLDAQQQRAGQKEEKNRTFRDIAILYRTHHQARLLEKTLSQEGIPYVVNGREDFLGKPLVRGTIQFFSSLIHPEDGGYQKDAQRLLWGTEETFPSIAYGQMAEKYREKWKKTSSKKLLAKWMEDLGRQEDKDLQKLLGISVLYPKMPEFLEALVLGEEGDLKRCSGKNYTPDAVQLMTLHGSKGLEFPVVILYGAGKGELPLESEKHPVDIQEERRLFYVGMTRAKEELILTYAKEPSEFLGEIGEDCVKKEHTGKARTLESGVQMSLFDFM